jgi:AbrB family looped-hinge helix DNA binding protein
VPRWKFPYDAYSVPSLDVRVQAQDRPHADFWGTVDSGRLPRDKVGEQLYSLGTIGRIGAKGQVVIPKALRNRAHLQPGDEIDFEFRNEQIVLTARRAPVRLGGRFANTGMAARLLEDRAREPR